MFTFVIMKTTLDILKGIHPGKFIERELNKMHISKRQFSFSVNEYPQTLGSIIKGNRKMNLDLALKIEQKLGLEEGFLMLLQLYYDINEIKQQQQNVKPDLSKLRTVLFWDTTLDKIDWQQQKKAIINRVFTRGNQEEKNEMIRFYGVKEVEVVLSKSKNR